LKINNFQRFKYPKNRAENIDLQGGGEIPFFLNEALDVIGYSTGKMAKCIRPIECQEYDNRQMTTWIVCHGGQML